jgi:outer membrane lipoprotein-sorting protein
LIRAPLVAALLVPALASAAPPPTVDQILSHLEQSAKSLHSLDGEFTQRNRVKLFKQELTSKGRLRFEVPRKIVWEYTEPDPSSLVLDGDQATLTVPGAAPRRFDLAQDPTLRAVFDQLLFFIGGKSGAVKKDYALEAAGSAAEPILRLTPRAGSPVAQAFRKIELRLDGKTWLLRSLLLVEQNGDEKELTFTRLQRR